MSEEIQAKADHLLRYMAKTAKRIEGEPDHPKVELWKRNWLDAQDRLANLKQYGKEHAPEIPKAPVGVQIDVPVAPFAAQGED